MRHFASLWSRLKLVGHNCDPYLNPYTTSCFFTDIPSTAGISDTPLVENVYEKHLSNASSSQFNSLPQWPTRYTFLSSDRNTRETDNNLISVTKVCASRILEDQIIGSVGAVEFSYMVMKPAGPPISGDVENSKAAKTECSAIAKLKRSLWWV